MKKIILAGSIAIIAMVAKAQTKFNLQNFSKIVVPANFEVKLVQSETNQISFQKEDNKIGNISSLEKGAKVNNDALTFNLSEFGSMIPVELIIYTNNIQEIKLESNAELSMGSDSALKVKQLRIMADGATKIELLVEADQLVAEINGASKLILDGKVRQGKLEATGASKINAIGTAFEDLSAEANGASKVLATVNNRLAAEASGFSKVEYAGNPKTVDKKVSGGSKVEQVNPDKVNEDNGNVRAEISVNSGKKNKSKSL